MSEPGIAKNILAQFRENFQADPKNRLAQNVCVTQNPLDVLRKRSTVETTSHVFSHKVESEGKPITNQRSSGRCWLYACLNCMRLPFMKQHKVEDFEFSQNYLFFWDKIERFNYLMQAFVDTARRGEAADGRLVQHLLSNPSEDGGQWHMLVNIVEKYGVVPRKCFPDTWNSENSRRLSVLTNTKMREYCLRLRNLVEKGTSEEDLKQEIQKMTEEMYRVASICIGTPPDTFTWEYYGKDKEYNKVGPISPLEFYRQYVKPYYNVEDKVVLVNDPRPENPYDKLYTVEYLGNMTGGRPVIYLNQPADKLKQITAESIKSNEAVWFGCDVGQHCSWKKHGINDLEMYDYELLFGVSVKGLDKAQRLLYRESLMTHAMVITAVNYQEDNITKWRVENSWGDDGGDKGYLVMTDDWFTEYVYEVVVDKKFVPKEMLEVLKQEPKVLPAWDPMGALANFVMPPSHKL